MCCTRHQPFEFKYEQELNPHEAGEPMDFFRCERLWVEATDNSDLFAAPVHER